MKFTRLATVAALAASAAADWEIFSPSSDVWWGTDSHVWKIDPAALAHPTFTVLVANSVRPPPSFPPHPLSYCRDPKVLTSPLAILSIENNFDCSKTITADQLNAAPGQGYTIQLANPLNSTDVFVSSKPFEIKPLGSTYPTTTPGTASSSPSATSSGANSAATSGSTDSNNAKGNGAIGMSMKAGSVVGMIAGVLGLVM
ncbi:hypothetical protein C0992_008515 [Termitomyces sp. T32_za158]|nr:hypothetical protein C0992_008515 [Termitomyces sp. T32_za158]